MGIAPKCCHIIQKCNQVAAELVWLAPNNEGAAPKYDLRQHHNPRASYRQRYPESQRGTRRMVPQVPHPRTLYRSHPPSLQNGTSAAGTGLRACMRSRCRMPPRYGPFIPCPNAPELWKLELLPGSGPVCCRCVQQSAWKTGRPLNCVTRPVGKSSWPAVLSLSPI